MTPEQKAKILAFLADLEPTRKLVESWPEWKRQPLGPLPTQPYYPPVELP